MSWLVGLGRTDHDARARRLGGPGPAHLLHRTARRRPRGDRRRRGGSASWRWVWAVRSTASSRATPTARHCARRSSGWTNGPPSSATDWSSKVGAELLAERTGLVADASHSAPKMMWIREQRTGGLAAAAMLAPVGSYVLHHLSGSHAQDAANASSTMVYDVAKGDFDTELCEAAGLDPAMLPPVRPSTEVVGTLAARRRRRARAADRVRGGRRHRRRTRRVGRGRRDRGRCRRRRHRHRRTGDDGRRRHPCATRSVSSRPTAMRCPAHG